MWGLGCRFACVANVMAQAFGLQAQARRVTKVMKSPQFGPVQHPHAKSEADAQRVVLSVLQGPHHFEVHLGYHILYLEAQMVQKFVSPMFLVERALL